MRNSRHFVWKGNCILNFAVERLDHLGMVAGVCQEIGLVDYFDGLDEREHARVSLGQAVLAMVLNGLGFSNRRLYLVPQFFMHKPVERLLGMGITAEDVNDDCLGRALDWLTAHDLTALLLDWPIKPDSALRWGRKRCMWTRPPLPWKVRMSARSVNPTRTSFASRMATRVTIGPTSNSGNCRWRPP